MMRTRSVALLIIVLTLAATAAVGRDVEEARKRVVLLQFLRGLHLTAEQMDSLLLIHREADSLRVAVARRDAQEQERFTRLLGELERYVASEAQIPDSLKRAVHELNRRRQARRAALETRLRDLESRAVAILTENQQHVARMAKLCLVPPKPGAIGQDQGTVPKGLERGLRRLRECPMARYERTRERFLDGWMRNMRFRFPDLPADSLEAARSRARSLLDRIRDMPEGEFLASLPSLAEELLPKAPKPRQEDDRYQNRRIGRLLLDPLVPELLEELASGYAEAP